MKAKRLIKEGQHFSLKRGLGVRKHYEEFQTRLHDSLLV
jgi:hypothetical protein